MKLHLTSLLSALLIAAAMPATAQQMNYQGRLTDASGNPYADGQYTIEFSLWDVATGGTNAANRVWGPFTLDSTAGNGKGPKADLVNGRFNAVLGAVDESNRPLSSAFGNTPRYLQIKVGTSAAISPRQAILDTPTSMMAQRIPNVWTSGANVGVGTDIPAGKLNILEAAGTVHGPNSGTLVLDHDNSGGASSVVFRSKVNRGSDYGFIQYQDTATVGGAGETARLILGTSNDGDDHMALMPAGNVGIGTLTPGARLEISNGAISLQVVPGQLNGAGNPNAVTLEIPGLKTLGIQDHLNVSNSATVQGGATISGGATINGGLNVNGGGSITGDYAHRAVGSRPLEVQDNTGAPIMQLWGPGSDAKLYLFGGAAKNDGNSSWGVFSDARLKSDVRKYTAGLAEIRRLNPVRYRYKENKELGLTAERENIGFIAQEVQKVIPEAVTAGRSGFFSLSVDPIHWAGINAIKELDSRLEKGTAETDTQIKTLTSENATLRDTVKAQEARLAKLEQAVATLAAAESKPATKTTAKR